MAANMSMATFENPDFNVTTFVTNLLAPDVANAVATGLSFDTVGYKNTLTKALNRLEPLRKEQAGEIASQERAIATAERSHKMDLRSARGGFGTAKLQLGSLEANIEQVSRVAVRLGEQFEAIDKVHKRAKEAYDLMNYYMDFARGVTPRLEQLRREGGREGRAKVATACRYLIALAREIDGTPDAERTRQAIEKYCERFENDMLKLFDRYYRKGDPKAMAHCAHTLHMFNGGQSCIQIYVNQHDFFINRDKVQDATQSFLGGDTWSLLTDPDAVPPRSEPGLENLFNEIKKTVVQEVQIVTAVFQNPMLVMQVFLQRVLQQVIQEYIESMLSAAQSVSPLVFLRTLHLIKVQLGKLVDDLKQLEFFQSSSSALLGSSLVPARVSESLSTDAAGLGSLSANGDAKNSLALTNAALQDTSGLALLDAAVDDLLQPYMEGVRYTQAETRNLNELFTNALKPFTSWHRQASASRTEKLLGRMVNLNQQPHVAPTTPTGEVNGSASPDPAAHVSAEIDPEDSTVSSDGVISTQLAEHMLSWHAEAIGRMIDLSSPSAIPKNGFSLLVVLNDFIATNYVETALNTALTLLNAGGPGNIDFKLLDVVHKANVLVQVWHKYLVTAVFPLASANVTTRREMSSFVNSVAIRIEDKINLVLIKVVDLTVQALSNALARQKRNDFKPRDDDLALSESNTEPCLAACDTLARFYKHASASLAGKNADQLMIDMGIQFHTLLLQHLKKFPVSAAGGLMLTKDLAMYQETIAQFGIPLLNDRFEMLRQLGNLFIVQPEILKSYMNESYLSVIDNKFLRPYVQLRSDYNAYAKKFWDDVFGVESSEGYFGGSRFGDFVRDLGGSLRVAD